MTMRFLFRLLALVALTSSAAFGNVAVNLFAGVLANSTGTAIPDGSLVQLISSGPDLNFSPLAAGSFTSGDDIVLESFAMNSSSGGGPGEVLAAFTGSTSIALTGGVAAGQDIAIRWFPTLASSAQASALVAGTPYGQFSAFTSDGALPSDGGQINPNFITNSANGGSGGFPNSDGFANFDVPGGGGSIPEPATFALCGGLAALGLAFRRRGSKANTQE
jgi:hypothetical protein